MGSQTIRQSRTQSWTPFNTHFYILLSSSLGAKLSLKGFPPMIASYTSDVRIFIWRNPSSTTHRYRKQEITKYWIGYLGFRIARVREDDFEFVELLLGEEEEFLFHRLIIPYPTDTIYTWLPLSSSVATMILVPGLGSDDGVLGPQGPCGIIANRPLNNYTK